MAKRANTAIKNSTTDNLAANFNAGKLRGYTGTQPASGDDAMNGTMLFEITLPNPAFGAASGGVASKAGTWQVSAVAAGVVQSARMLSGDLAKSIDYAVTITGGGGDMEVQNTNIANGQQVTVTTATLTGLSGA